MVRLPLATLSLAVTLTTACVPRVSMGLPFPWSEIVADRAEPAATAPAADEPEPAPIIDVVRPGQAGPVDLQPRPARPAPPSPFDPGAAYGAVAGVDLAPCKDEGLASGYGHVVVGFMPDGSVGGVAVDLPPASSPWAHGCVENELRQMRIASFDGEQPMNVRRDFYVR
jgi:hypothetical protein